MCTIHHVCCKIPFCLGGSHALTKTLNIASTKARQLLIKYSSLHVYKLAR